MTILLAECQHSPCPTYFPNRRTAYRIGHDLVPLFGPGFPATCLTPEQPGFGQLMLVSNKKQRRRAPNPSAHQTSCFGPPKPVQ